MTWSAKIFTTHFFPVGEETQRIVADWAEHLRERLLWSLTDPLFPATLVDAEALVPAACSRCRYFASAARRRSASLTRKVVT